MSEENKINIYDKWDAYIEIGSRRVVYSSLAGAVTALILFRSPVTRWSAVAFGAGIGIGSAYTECSYKFNEFSAKPAIPKVAEVPSPEAAQE